MGILTGAHCRCGRQRTSLVCGVVCSWVGKSHDQN